MTQSTRPAFIQCARCGTEKKVGERGPIPTYCSVTCRLEKSRAHVQISCAFCGEEAQVRPGTVYCSPRCRNARSYRQARADGRYDEALRKQRQETAERRAVQAQPCPYCSDPMDNPRRKQCGKPDCKRRFDADRGREWQRQYQKKTGQWYHRVNYAEQQREYNRRRSPDRPSWRKQNPGRAALLDARRRMRMRQARTGEIFAPRDVYQRDGWTCGLCRRPVDPAIVWPHPMSASVDHMVPLSRGGEHSMANVQCAHLGCNSSKGDRADIATTYVPSAAGAAGALAMVVPGQSTSRE